MEKEFQVPSPGVKIEKDSWAISQDRQEVATLSGSQLLVWNTKSEEEWGRVELPRHQRIKSKTIVWEERRKGWMVALVVDQDNNEGYMSVIILSYSLLRGLEEVGRQWLEVGEKGKLCQLAGDGRLAVVVTSTRIIILSTATCKILASYESPCGVVAASWILFSKLLIFLDERGRIKIFSPLLQPLLLSYQGSLHSAVSLGRILGKEEDRVDPSLFSLCTLQTNLLVSSGSRAVLLPIPSPILSPLPWPRLHLAKARMLLTGQGTSALVKAMLSKETKENSTASGLALIAKEKVRKLRRRLGLATGTKKLLKKTEQQETKGLDSMLVASEPSLPANETGFVHLNSALQHLALCFRSKRSRRILKEMLEVVAAASWNLCKAEDFLVSICDLCEEDLGRTLLIGLGALVKEILAKTMSTCNEKDLTGILVKITKWGRRLEEIYGQGGGRRQRILHSSLLLLHSHITTRWPHSRDLVCQVQKVLQQQHLHLGHLHTVPAPSLHQKALHHLLAGQLHQAVNAWVQEINADPSLLPQRAPLLLQSLLIHFRLSEALALLVWVDGRAESELTQDLVSQLTSFLSDYHRGKPMNISHPVPFLPPVIVDAHVLDLALQQQGLEQAIGPGATLHLLLDQGHGEESVQLVEDIGNPLLGVLLRHCTAAHEVWQPLLNSLSMAVNPTPLVEEELRHVLALALVTGSYLLPSLLSTCVARLERQAGEEMTKPFSWENTVHHPPLPIWDPEHERTPREPLHTTMMWCLASLRAGGQNHGEGIDSFVQRMCRVVVELMLKDTFTYRVGKVFTGGRVGKRAEEGIEAAIKLLNVCHCETSRGGVIRVGKNLLREVKGSNKEELRTRLEDSFSNLLSGNFANLPLFRQVVSNVEKLVSPPPGQLAIIPANRWSLLDQIFPKQVVNVADGSKDNKSNIPTAQNETKRCNTEGTKKGLFRSTLLPSKSNRQHGEELERVLEHPLWESLTVMNKQQRKDVEVMNEDERVVGALYCWYKKWETERSSLWPKNKNNVGLSIGLCQLLECERHFREKRKDCESQVGEQDSHQNIKEKEHGKAIPLMSTAEKKIEDEISKKIVVEKTESAFFPSDQDNDISVTSSVSQTTYDESGVHPSSPVRTIGDLSILDSQRIQDNSDYEGDEDTLVEEEAMENIVDPKNHSPNFHSEYETVSEVPPLCLDDVASIQSPKAESTFHDLSSLRTFSTPRDQNSSNSDSMPTKCSDFDDSYLSSATSAPCKIVPAPPLPLLVMDKEEDLAKAKVSVKPTEVFINKREDHSNLQNTFVNSIKTSEQKTHEHQLIGGKIEQLRLLSFENPKQLMDKKMPILSLDEKPEKKGSENREFLSKDESSLILLQFEPEANEKKFHRPSLNIIRDVKKIPEVKPNLLQEEHPSENKNIVQRNRELEKKRQNIESLERKLSHFQSRLLKQRQQPAIALKSKDPCGNLDVKHDDLLGSQSQTSCEKELPSVDRAPNPCVSVQTDSPSSFRIANERSQSSSGETKSPFSQPVPNPIEDEDDEDMETKSASEESPRSPVLPQQAPKLPLDSKDANQSPVSLTILQTEKKEVNSSFSQEGQQASPSFGSQAPRLLRSNNVFEIDELMATLDEDDSVSNNAETDPNNSKTNSLTTQQTTKEELDRGNNTLEISSLEKTFSSSLTLEGSFSEKSACLLTARENVKLKDDICVEDQTTTKENTNLDDKALVIGPSEISADAPIAAGDRGIETVGSEIFEEGTSKEENKTEENKTFGNNNISSGKEGRNQNSVKDDSVPSSSCSMKEGDPIRSSPPLINSEENSVLSSSSTKATVRNTTEESKNDKVIDKDLSDGKETEILKSDKDEHEDSQESFGNLLRVESENNYNTESADEDSSEDSLVCLMMATASTLEERLAALQMLTSNTMDEFSESSSLLDTIEKVGQWDREDVQDLLNQNERVEDAKPCEGPKRCGEMLARYRQSQELGVILEVDSRDNSETS